MQEKILRLCTCTAIEIMTAIGVTTYLLIVDKIMLATMAIMVFSPLILFHLLMDNLDKRQVRVSKNKYSRSI